MEFFYQWTKDDVSDVILRKLIHRQEKEQKEVQGKLDKLCTRQVDKKFWDDHLKPALESLQKERYKRINDPIHGTIELHPLLCKIIDTPEFHRLNDIKQLGGVHYVYPNARHTRFEHSIGVCYLAGEFARTLQKNQPELKITDKDVLCVEIAGLIHDLGHGPFSHMFEYGVYKQLKLQLDSQKPAAGKQPLVAGGEVEQPEQSETIRKRQQREEDPQLPPRKKQHLSADLEPLEWEHEILSQKVFKDRIYESLQKEFEKYGISVDDIDFITQLIHYETEKVDHDKKFKDKTFLFQIVANKYCGIDVDKWDYFARDGHFIGVAHDFDFRRLMSMSRVIWVKDKGWRICFRIKEMNNIYGMFRTRCSLFQRALHHKTKIAAELMLCRAIALAAEDIKLTSKEWSLEEAGGIKCKEWSIKDAVFEAQKYTTESTQSLGSGLLDGFLALTDGIIYAIKIADSKDLPRVEEAQKLLHRLATRDLFHEKHLEEKEANAEYEIEVLQRAVHEKWRGAVFVQQVDYKYGSESNLMNGGDESTSTAKDSSNTKVDSSNTKIDSSNTKKVKDDPVRKVYFYDHKTTPMKAECDKDPKATTDLVRPDKFSVSQIKVYYDPHHSDLKADTLDEDILQILEDNIKTKKT